MGGKLLGDRLPRPVSKETAKGARVVITYRTSDGGTIQVTRWATLTDLHYRDVEGRTVATLIRPHAEADNLVKGLAHGTS